MSKIRFIFAIILSLSIITNGLLAKEMHSVPSELIRKKRYTYPEKINLNSLFTHENYYINAINSLRDSFTRRDNNGNMVRARLYDIPILRGGAGGTVVELVGSDQVGSVQLVFRNSNLYTIGFIRDGVFYRMREGNINEGITVCISSQNIRNMPPVTAYVGSFDRIDIDPDNLIHPLIRYAERRNAGELNEESGIPTETRNSIYQFALIMAEAIRFNPIQREVQRTLTNIRNTFQPSTVNLNLGISEAIRSPSSPDYIPTSTDTTINLSWMLRQWRSFTEFIDSSKSDFHACVVHKTEHLLLDNRVLASILGLANACINPNLPGHSRRFPRDTESYSPDKCYVGDVGREGIITGNSYWDIDSAPILISEILNTHIDYGASAHAG